MVTRERFETGLGYEAFLAQMPEGRRAEYEANYAATAVPGEARAVLRGLPVGTRCLVLAEDWCHDTGYNLPVLARLLAEAPEVDWRVFPRDQNLDLMDRYLKDGLYRSIPVFVFF